jgi:hypothetical protein
LLYLCIGSGDPSWEIDYGAFRTMEAVMQWFFPAIAGDLLLNVRRRIIDVSFIVEANPAYNPDAMQASFIAAWESVSPS